MTKYLEIFKPFTDLFTQSQINTILLAWLPSKLEPYMTGIIAVDMFITSVIASGISTLFPALYHFIVTGGIWRKKSITIQIEYYNVGKYGSSEISEFFEALSWIISQQTKKLNQGSFVVQLVNSTNNDCKDDEFAPPDINILPEEGQQITIEYKGKKFRVEFRIPAHMSSRTPAERRNDYDYYDDDDYYYYDSSHNDSDAVKPKPSIYLTVEDSNTNLDSITEFLNEIVRSHLETKKRIKIRSRYERDRYWYYVQSLSSIRGLESIALEESQEKLLIKELETFVNDKGFYERTGLPYRRGILLYGKPGTGKTSLINAISSHLSRDVYYLNLKNIKDDNDLNAAFSDVPSNQIIVLEDVDTQSRVLHKRKGDSNPSKPLDNKKKEGSSKVDKFSEFSLSTFLGCLDGHILSEGNIIIMTTNHVEHLDPACIRPGRMDVHLNLGYCTHYQIKKMYKSVSENPEIEFPQDILEKIPEKLLPPCEVMMTMVLYRNEIDIVPQKIYELVAKYEKVKPEEEIRYIEEASVSLEGEGINSEVICAKEDSDCDTDVGVEDKNDKIEHFEIVETFAIASEAA